MKRARSAAAIAAARAYEQATPPGPRTPWAEASWCVVDLELSGLDHRRHEIVSFAAIPVEHGRVQLRDAVAGLVRPARALSESSIRIHGLRAADLEHAPPLAEAIVPLLHAMAGRVLVAHFARVERAFLSRALREQGARLHGPIVDTEVIGRLWLCERDGAAGADSSLGALAAALGLPAVAQHDALGDALTTAQVFIAAAAHLDALAPQTVRTLEHARRRLQAAMSYPTGGSVVP
ncbi:MAG TPA: exonuclease domain-containing protein [Solirubrobacteraceae bacterium]